MNTEIQALLTVSETWKAVEALECRARQLRGYTMLWAYKEAEAMETLGNKLRELLKEWGRSDD